MIRWQLGIGAVALVLGAGQALATSTVTRLSPKNAEANGLKFAVTARELGDAREVEVVVTPGAGKELSPFLQANLALYDGNKLILSCPVEKREVKGAISYSFTVSATSLGRVQFTFNEYAYAKSVEKDGKVTIRAMPAVDRVWFVLGDFLGSK